MSTVGLRRLYFWFAAGTWAGATAASAVEQLVRPIPTTPRDLPVGILIFLLVPFSFLLALLFSAWLILRSWRTTSPRTVTWCVPFGLGVCYLPLSSVLIWLFIEVTGKGQGIWIGTFVYILTFGLPLLFAELAFRFGHPLSE